MTQFPQLLLTRLKSKPLQSIRGEYFFKEICYKIVFANNNALSIENVPGENPEK